MKKTIYNKVSPATPARRLPHGLSGSLAALILAGLLTLGACSRDKVNDRTLPASDTPVVIEGETPTDTGEPAGTQEWQATDALGFFMLATGGTLPADILTVNGVTANNIQCVAAPGSPPTTATFAPEVSGNKLYYPQSGNVDLIAYYPYGTTGTGTGEVTTDYKYNISVADQSTAEKQAALDVLWAKTAGTAKSNSAVTMQFGHVMSKVTLDVKAGDGFTAADIAALAAPAVVLGGMPTTAVLALEDGTLTAGTLLTQTFSPLKADTPTATYDATFTAIVVPQAAGSYTGRKVTFTVGGEEFVWSIPDAHAFAAGSHYTYPVTVRKTGISVGDATITAWNETAPDTGDIEGIGIYTAADLVNFSNDWNAACAFSDPAERTAAQRAVIANWSGNGEPDGTIYLRNDINMTGVTGFHPIGRNSGGGTGTAPHANYDFTGKFDGQGHTITGLTVNVGSDYFAGLFGKIGGGGSVSNLTMKDCGITGGNDTGTIAGVNSGTISGCSVIGSTTVTGEFFSGGVVGDNSSGLISGCSVSGTTTVTASANSGGIAGQNSGGTISGCSVSGITTVTASNNSGGGVAGWNYNGGTISACVSAPQSVNGYEEIGVVVGWNQSTATISTCYWLKGVVSGDPAVGSGSGTVTGGGAFDNGDREAPEIVNMLNNTIIDFNANFHFAADTARENGGYPVIRDNAPGVEQYGIWSPYGLKAFAADWNAACASSAASERTAAQRAVIARWSGNGQADGTVYLRDDIDMTSAGNFAPIGRNSGNGGDMSYVFTGKFDGRGHTITGLTVNLASNPNAGLFGWIGRGGSVSNLTMKDCTIDAGTIVGTIAGHNYGTISGCSVLGTTTVTAMDSSGGIAGQNAGQISGCSVSGTTTVTASNNSGGIAGRNGGTITACVAAPQSVSGFPNIGLVVGDNGATITTCYWLKGVVSGDPAVGSGSVTGGGSFAATAVGSPTYFFTSGISPNTPIELMNTALQAAGITGWKWVQGAAASNYYPVIEKQ